MLAKYHCLMFVITPYQITCGDNPVNLLTFSLHLFPEQQDTFPFNDKCLEVMSTLVNGAEIGRT